MVAVRHGSAEDKRVKQTPARHPGCDAVDEIRRRSRVLRGQAANRDGANARTRPRTALPPTRIWEASRASNCRSAHCPQSCRPACNCCCTNAVTPQADAMISVYSRRVASSASRPPYALAIPSPKNLASASRRILAPTCPCMSPRSAFSAPGRKMSSASALAGFSISSFMAPIIPASSLAHS